MLELHQIVVRKGSRTILERVSATIQQGSITFLGGKNGIGKSTLLSAILGVESVKEGEILLDGANIKDIWRSDFFGQVGAMIGQNYYMNLTVRENLDLIRRYYSLPVGRVEELLITFHLQEYANLSAEKLSMGVKQRLCLAITFVHEPHLLVLDEPFNSLDPDSVLSLRNIIHHLNATLGVTFLISCHSLDEVQRTFDKFILLINQTTIKELSKSELENLLYIELPAQSQASPVVEICSGYKQNTDGRTAFLIEKKYFEDEKWGLFSVANYQRDATLEDFYHFNI